MKICPLEHSKVYRKFSNLLKAERVAIKKEDDKTEYLVYTIEENPVAVVGWQKISDTHFRLKTDYVSKPFRGKKIYSELWDSRMFIILREEPKVLSAYCTPMSLPKYLKEGFIKQSVNKQGIVYVKKEL